jgi:putative FmdB family regulatory protein
MPVYEYRCNACHREFEYQQRMTEDDKVTCESCGKDALERLISRTAFQFKGGGWYKDLYASSKPEKSGDSGGGGDAKSASDSTASTSTPASSSAASGSGGTSTPSGGSSSGSGSSTSSAAAAPAGAT